MHLSRGTRIVDRNTDEENASSNPIGITFVIRSNVQVIKLYQDISSRVRRYV